MPEPTMHMPQQWRDTDFGRRYYTEGWHDGLAGEAHHYEDVQAALHLVREQGQAALLTYEDGYKASQDAME